MTIEGTRTAFGQLLEIKGVHRYLGVSAPTVSNWKRYLASGEQISIDKMEEMLLRFGAEVKQEKVWVIPSAGRLRDLQLDDHGAAGRWLKGNRHM